MCKGCGSCQNNCSTPATITVHERVTAATFGCTERFFEEHVKGKALKVLGKFNQFFKVLPEPDGNPETDFYLVHESELLGKEHLHTA